ncbi:MAG: ATP-binding protein [Candidatus Thermoplasmatota archaeon]|nr:ATP-binding protein [Candidatus Thermoplasmatota archaeon]
MKLIEVLDLIRKGESDTVEFKRRLSPDCARNVVAFLNTVGGIMIFGLDNDGAIVGMEGATEYDKIAQSIEPPPFKRLHWEDLQFEGRRIGLLHVDKSSHLHTYRNVAYMRIGTMCKPLSIEELVEKASESLLLRFDQMTNPYASMNDFDPGLVKRFFSKRNESRNVSIPDASIDDTLLMIGAANRVNSHICPTNAGILFFFKDPQRIFVQSSVRVVVFRDNDMLESLDTRIFKGPLNMIIEDVVPFIDRYIPLTSTLQNGSMSRATKRAYPLIAIREALINAISHRNYLDMADTRVFIFPDRIEIINAGGFPPGVDPENPIHKPRNPILSQYFYDLGYVERYGSGIRRMITSCLDLGISPPRFHIREFETKVIFSLGENKNHEGRIMALIQKNGSASSGEMAGYLGVGRDTVNRNLKTMLEKGKINKIGRGRGTRYKLP